MMTTVLVLLMAAMEIGMRRMVNVIEHHGDIELMSMPLAEFR